MAELAKAQLVELSEDFQSDKPDGQQTKVQFNPESLKVTFANQIVQPPGGDQSSGSAGRQFVGAGTTKLALQLWFDVTAMDDNPVDDVRRLTQKVVFFMTPQKSQTDASKLMPPAVSFRWGSFKFDGMVEALEETLDFFSPDGKPLRASINLTMSQQKILKSEFEGDGRVPRRPGQQPLKAAKQGDSVQGLAGKNGKSDWQSVAAANGIEDPLRLAAGQLVNLSLGVGGASVGAGFSVGVGGGASLSAGTGINSSLRGGASASLSSG